MWQGWCTKDELDEVERRFIQDGVDGRRPRLNYLLNEDNPQRIPKWVQEEQRHQRDDREDRPRWMPPEQRTRAGLLDAAPPAPWNRPTSRHWPAWVHKTLRLSTAWCLLLPLWWGAADRAAGWPQAVDAAVGGVVSLLMLAWGVVRNERWWQARMRAFRRKLWRWLRREFR